MEAAFFKVPGRPRPNIACVSTQVGCAVGCPFCAAAPSGLLRNLSSEEIFHQIVTILEDRGWDAPLGEGFEVSFMGMGEPLANLPNLASVIAAIEAHLPEVTRVSISTSGPSKRIDQLTDLAPHSPGVHLQISLHATTDDLRSRLVPNVRDSIDRLIGAGSRYFAKTGDRVCLNYVLLHGINDGDSDAQWLSSVDPDAFYVKITQLNQVPGLSPAFRAPSLDRIAEFARLAGAKGVPTKIFIGDGLDVQASCGQLASRPRLYEGGRGSARE